MGKIKNFLISLFLFCFLSGCVRSCSSSSEEIKHGQDSCELCHMSISDPRFAAEILTQKGRVYKFDSISCLLNFYHKGLKEEPKTVFVADYLPPHNLIDATTAYFFDSPDLTGPMGPTPIASANLVELQKVSETFKGVMKDWKDILALQAN